MSHRRSVRLTLSFCLLLSAQARAEPTDAPPRSADAAASSAKLSESKAPKVAVPVYVPASRGQTRKRAGAATRGNERELPQLELIAPQHTGLTTQSQPSLYWYLSRVSPVPVQITIVVPNQAEPLLSLRLPGPVAAGLHVLALADHDVALQADVEYSWYVAMVPDESQRSQDQVAAAGLRVASERAPAASTLHALAEAGLWYDLFEALQQQLRASVAGERQQQLRAAQAALLAQVGLTDLDL